MAHRPRPRYQGGASFNVFSAQGSNPTSDCKVCGKGVQKLYDKSVKGYVYSLCGGPMSRIQLPKDESKAGLQLLQPFLLFQIFVPVGHPLVLELRVSDTTNTRRKMYFSTSFSDIKCTPLHCQIPITMITRNIWLSFSIHVADLFSHCFRSMVFKSVDIIVLGSVCKIRKIFTMRNRLVDFGGLSNSMEMNGEDCLSQEHMFALGVDNEIQVLDMTTLQIAGLSDPSFDVFREREECQKLRKVKQNKLEPRQVHVAFGSRMPLPLSTVQINTNLPGDNKTHTHGVFLKDRTGHIGHMHTELLSSTQEQKCIESKFETLQKLLKHANSVHKDVNKTRVGKASELEGNPSVIGVIERLNDVQSTGPKVELLPAFTNTKAVKTKANDVVFEGITALTDLTDEEFQAMHQNENTTNSNLQPPTDEVNIEDLGEGMEVEVSKTGMETNGNKIVIADSTKLSKIKDEKRDPGVVGLGKYVRRGSHLENIRGKEYKQIRYMDSPPESPPCGWTSCIEQDGNEGKPFSESTLEGLSLFSKINDKENLLEMEHSQFESATSATSKSPSPYLVDVDYLKKDLDLTDDIRDSDVILDNLSYESSTMNLMRSTTESIDNLMEDRARPVGAVHEKYDLGNDDSFMLHDSESTTMSDEDNIGRHSWSSSDSQTFQGLSLDFCLPNSHPSRFFNDGVIHDDTWKLEYAYIRNIMQDEEEHFKMYSTIAGKCQNEQPPISNDKKTADDIQAQHYLSISSDNCIKNNEPSEYNGISDYHIKDLGLLSNSAQPQSRISNRDLKMSIDVDKDHLPSHEMMDSSTSWQSENVLDHQSKASFSFENEQRYAQQKAIKTRTEQEDIVDNNERLDEDLDLLYDPTLDCYYDPKTNRYYELK